MNFDSWLTSSKGKVNTAKKKKKVNRSKEEDKVCPPPFSFYKILDVFRISNLERKKAWLVYDEFFAQGMSQHHMAVWGVPLNSASEISLPFKGITDPCFISALIS